jgi:hypothetical protein
LIAGNSEATAEEKETATLALRRLAYSNPLATAYDNPTAIVNAGACSPLVALLVLQSGDDGVGGALLPEHAAAALCNLASTNANRTAIAAAGAILPLLALVAEGTDSIAFQAAFALGSLAFKHDPNRRAIHFAEIGRESGEAIVRALTARAQTEEQKSIVAYTLCNLGPRPAADTEVVIP